MAIENIIAKGIGFSPGSTKFIPTHGFTTGAAAAVAFALAVKLRDDSALAVGLRDDSALAVRLREDSALSVPLDGS